MAEEIPREVAPWIEWLARLGYAAKAVLYGTIGILALKAAVGSRGRVTDTRGALRTVEGFNFGQAVLFLIAAGFVGYAVWRVVQAVFDPEQRGTEPKALAVRAGFLIRGLVHGALGITTLRLATGHSSSGENQAQHWSAKGLSLPAGDLLLLGAALAIAGYGFYQLYRGWAAKLSRELRLSQLSEPMRKWIIGASRFGIAARGVVFCLIGFLLARSALHHDPSEAGGLRESLHQLAGLGRWALGAVALGLTAYGVYELVNARYRAIEIR